MQILKFETIENNIKSYTANVPTVGIYWQPIEVTTKWQMKLKIF